MSSAIVINETHAIYNPSTNSYSTFQYNFPGNTSFDNKQLLPSVIVYPFSNFNFTSYYQNNSFQVIWIDGTVLTVTLPNGYYSYQDISQFLDQVMIDQTWYTINSGTPVTYNYYLQIQDNVTFYACQLNSVPVPTAAQAATAGITQPAGATWSWPVVPTNPQFVIPAVPTPPNQYGTSFSVSTGFEPQTWPPAQTPGSGQSLLSSFTPQINPVTTVVVLCSLINNTFAANNQVIYAFNTGETAFGSYLTINVPQEIWLNCSRGYFPNFTLSFVDQTLRNLVPLQDPTVTVIFSIRDTPPDLRGLKLLGGK
jgi:hypothetical protein